MSDNILQLQIAADAREARGRAAYEAAQQQPIFGYGLRWSELEEIERAAWCAVGDSISEVAARQLATSHALEGYWQQQHAEAWRLIGRLDYAFEEIVKAKTLATARQWATKMRAEITAHITRRNEAT